MASANVAWKFAGGEFSINISTDSVLVAKDVCKTVTTLGEVARDVCKTAGDVARDVCITAVSLSALYLGYKLVRPLIETAVTRGLGDERDDQEVRGIRPGSLHVLLHCFTDERFLEVLADYESGRMKERLQEEFSQIGIKVEGLKVEIENMVEVNETKEAINKRSHINKDLCEDVKNIVIDDVESDLEINKQTKKEEKMKKNVSELASKQKALEKMLNMHGEDHFDTALSYFNIGNTQYEMKDYKSALESHQHALQIRLKLFGEDHSDTALSYWSLGRMQHEMKDYKSALESSQHALQIRLKLFGEDHSDTARSYHSIGVAQYEMKDYKSALESDQYALRIRLNLFGKNHSDMHCCKLSQHCSNTIWNERLQVSVGI
ncbi:Nephrocystin-3 [Paramuricea clavata]|uniref:Nephrocystin-3 n=1 Tax=Paramuricea clavata TaxID=317549 RepID=A0A6S7I532_PARCT|nr:Nephrocystin-3 [Paramuricea clavata]